MTLDYIEFHAAERPDAVAFIDNGREITYRRFSSDIRRFIRAMQGFGLTRGAWVGVGCADIYLHWVLLLALDRLGIATISMFRREKPGANRLLARLSLVISEWTYPGVPIKAHHAITPAWLEEVRALTEIGDEALPQKSGDDIVRILRTTGTTGEPKVLCSPRRTLEPWADCWAWKLGLSARSRYLLTSPLEVNTIYTLAIGALRAGSTVVLETRMHIAEAMSKHAITDVCLFPIDLKAVLDALPQGFEKRADLAVTTFGAIVSDELRAEVMTKLANTLYDDYGTREVGYVSRIAARGSRGVGLVSPNVQVEVVDDFGVVLPFGHIGRLRIKSPFMHTEYFDDPVTTGETFQDGWFVSSDLAVLQGPRRLQLVGRSDEALNIGGRKFSPDLIEDTVQRASKARDAGVFSSLNRNGIEEIWIAVTDAPVDDKELCERIINSLKFLQFAQLHVVRLPAIPRNHGGKVQRDLLRQAVAEAREITRPT
jgi:acyl-coenzyme A synthetase/AMP-(fatty) acid ligase